MRKNLTPRALLKQILSDNFQSRFWKKVKVSTPNQCWPWTGSSVRGYGRAYLPKSGEEYAHRAAWMTFHKTVIPKEKPFILHSCIGNPRCCNPRHLRAGTPQENTDDMKRQGRALFYNPHPGDDNGRAKLSTKDVVKIRKMYVPRKMSYPKIAKIYGVCIMQIQRIIHREQWRHI